MGATARKCGLTSVAATLVLALAVGIASAGFSSGGAAGNSHLKPSTLMKVGDLGAFAQDARYIVWIDYSRPCAQMLRVRDLGSAKTVSLLARRGPTCRGIEEALPGEIALAGRFVLWEYMFPGNVGYYTEITAAAPGVRERAVGYFQQERNSDEGEMPYIPIPLAGDGGTLAYLAPASADFFSDEEIPAGVVRVTARGTTEVPGTTGADVFAVADGELALPRSLGEQGRKSFEIRRAIDGRLINSFDLSTEVKAIAFDAKRIALVVAGGRTRTLELRTRTGTLTKGLTLYPGAADEISLAGRWVVYRTGRTIRIVDTRAWKQSVLTIARGSVIGLSSEGRRVAWGEQRKGTDLIRAVTLPR